MIAGRLEFQTFNNKQSNPSFKAHQPPAPQQQQHPPPAAGAAAPGQDTGGAGRKGRAATQITTANLEQQMPPSYGNGSLVPEYPLKSYQGVSCNLYGKVSPAADQPESRAAGQPQRSKDV
eukprot:400960-Pelagomonas_calceolata.AAC.1